MKLDAQIDNLLTKEQLEKDYLELQSIKKISNKYGVSISLIHNRLIEYNIPRNPYRQNKYFCNHNLFSQETAKVFYLAGFVAADGCIRIGKQNKNKSYITHRVVISLSIKDLDFLYMLRDAFECENPIGIYNHNLSEYNHNWNNVQLCKFAVTSKQMVSDLAKFNIGPRKTFTYEMPEWLISHPLVHHFIRGYNDGDGSFWIATNRSNRHITFSLRGTLPFLNQIKSIFTTNNIITKAIPKLSGNIGQFTIHANEQVAKLTEYLYKDASIFLPRKYEIAKKAKQILDIKDKAEREIQNILGHNR